MDPRTQAWQDLFDRGTSPERLQEIALNYPDFWEAVLEHPNVYPELAQWISQQPVPPAHTGPDFTPGSSSLPDDDLRPAVPLETPASGSRVPKILLTSLVLVLVLALVGGLIFWFAIGRKIQGAATPEGAVEKLITAAVEADALSLYGSLAPSEIAPLREVLESAESLQDVEGGSEITSELEVIWSALEISVTDLEFELVELDDGIIRVDVVSGEIEIAGNKRELKRQILAGYEQALQTAGVPEDMVAETLEHWEYNLQDFFDYNWPVRAEVADLFDAAESRSDYNGWFTGIPIVTVEEGGRWYVSPMLTYGELFRVAHENDYYSEGRYRYGTVPEAAVAASPQEAFNNLAAGVERLAERGRPDEFIAALPLAERRLLGLHLALFDNAGSGGKMDISGTVQVTSQSQNRAILQPEGVEVLFEDEWGYTSEYEFDGLCGRYTYNWSSSDRFCLDRDLDDAIGFDLELDLTNLGLVAVKEGGNWHLSFANTFAQLAEVVLDNLDQEFLDSLGRGIAQKHIADQDRDAEWWLASIAWRAEDVALSCYWDEIDFYASDYEVEVRCDGWAQSSTWIGSNVTFLDGYYYDTYNGYFLLSVRSGSGKTITYDSGAGGIQPY